MTNSEQLAALFRIAAVHGVGRAAEGLAWPALVARFMVGLYWIWCLVAPCALSAASLPEGLRPQGGLDFPLDAQGRVLTALRRSFPHDQDLPPGPSLAAARRAASRLPFVMALASVRQTDSESVSPRASYMLHGAFRLGNPPLFRGSEKYGYAAVLSFCLGVMPPMPMLGRSLL